MLSLSTTRRKVAFTSGLKIPALQAQRVALGLARVDPNPQLELCYLS